MNKVLQPWGQAQHFLRSESNKTVCLGYWQSTKSCQLTSRIRITQRGREDCAKNRFKSNFKSDQDKKLTKITCTLGASEILA